MDRLKFVPVSIFIIIISGCGVYGPGTSLIETDISRTTACSSQIPIKCDQPRYIGEGTFTDLGLADSQEQLGNAINADADGRIEISGVLQFWRSGDFYISASSQTEVSDRMVVATARALKMIKLHAPLIFSEMVDSHVFKNDELIQPWRNRNKAIVVSFDVTPASIASQTTLVDTQYALIDGVGYYDNTALVSIDSETIQGSNPTSGSRPIYKKDHAADNFDLYLNDGLVYSIAHEFMHTLFDLYNSVSPLAVAVSAGRRAPEVANGMTVEQAKKIAAARVDAEEALVVYTSLYYLDGFLSDDMKQEASFNMNLLLKKKGVKEALQTFCDLAVIEKVMPIKFQCPITL